MEILVVEDDDALREVVVVNLAAQGWSVRAVGDGEAALVAAAEKLPEIVVLDIMLPKRTGLEVCRELRLRHDPSPGVIMVTAKDTELDIVMGYDAGADDYVVKPFRPRILVARIAALARRIGAKPTSPVIERGPLRVNCEAREAAVRETALKLTPTEYSLLEFLMKNEGRAYSRMELLKEIWDTDLSAYARNVDCHVTRLRRKLEAAGMNPAPIETVQRTGYLFRLQAS
jgi:DNA-binding response OmpR family regulator